MGEMRNTYSVLVGKSERKNHSEDLGVDRRIILEWMKQGVRVWTVFIRLRIGTSGWFLCIRQWSFGSLDR
jgi:hypothetical protein